MHAGVCMGGLPMHSDDISDASMAEKTITTSEPTFILEDMHPLMQDVFDPLIQKFRVPAFVTKAHKGQKRLYSQDGTMVPLKAFLVPQYLKMEDAIFLFPP